MNATSKARDGRDWLPTKRTGRSTGSRSGEAIKRVGKAVVLLPKDAPFDGFFEALTQFGPDFMEERDQPAVQQREALF